VVTNPSSLGTAAAGTTVNAILDVQADIGTEVAYHQQ